METSKLETTQRERDASFAAIVERLKKVYHEKNLQYGDAYRQVNNDLNDAFQDVQRKVELIEVTLKYKDRVFKPQKFISDVGDMVIYGVMFIDLVEAWLMAEEKFEPPTPVRSADDRIGDIT